MGYSQRYQPTSDTAEHRKAQDYTFEPLHRIYFYDAWRPDPVLDSPGSELVLPPKAGLLTDGCYWPLPGATDDVFSVSDAETAAADHQGQLPASPTTTDATMSGEGESQLVSVLSSPSESSTLPSSVVQVGTNSLMEEEENDATGMDGAGDCLSNCPSSPNSRPANEAMENEGGEVSSALPPQGVDTQDDSSPAHAAESPTKRRPGTKPGPWKAQTKKLRQTVGQEPQPALGSIPEYEQQPVTLEDLANRTAPVQESPPRQNPDMPTEHPETPQGQQQAMTEIDLDDGQGNTEQGGTAATDLQLASEQTAMQGLLGYQIKAHAAAATARKRVELPPLQLYSGLPREWPMARLCISNKQVNRFVRTILWRRVVESALHGTYFGDIPAEVNPAYITDLLRISEAFAAPLANLFSFVEQGHPPCSFIPPKQLALYANPMFWQYGLLAFVSGCCENTKHRRTNASAARVTPCKQEESGGKDVDALTFMQTVIMSFVRGMQHGEQTLPINDLFVYLPVQLLPALVEAIGQQGFEKAEVLSGWGYRPRKEGAEDNPLLVAGVYSKEVPYANQPPLPDTSWAERAYCSGALDPSLGQSMSFPTLLQLKLRIEVPLWRNLAEARNPPVDPQLEESDTDSDSTGAKEQSPRYAQPVPVGAVEPQEVDAEEATEDKEAVDEPTYTFAQGHGRFAIHYTRLATALGNFEQGNAQAESAVVAGWLTSGLNIAMSRAAWNLLSPRRTLTRLPSRTLYNYFYYGYPFLHEDDRPYHQYGNTYHTDDQWEWLCAWLSGDPTFRRKIERHKKELKDKIRGTSDDAGNRTKAWRLAPPPSVRNSSSAARSEYRNRPPPPPPSRGWWQ